MTRITKKLQTSLDHIDRMMRGAANAALAYDTHSNGDEDAAVRAQMCYSRALARASSLKMIYLAMGASERASDYERLVQEYRAMTDRWPTRR
jgi:hypothetical protein